jgi:limonene-1,2-epoxide hydrolase
MKQLILFIAICFSIISCKSDTDKKTSENIALVEKYLHAVDSNDVGTMESLLADNYKGYGPSIGDSITKKEAIENWKEHLTNLYETLDFTQSQIIALTIPEGPTAGDWVSNWVYLTIKYKDGRGPVHIWVNAIYKIENGKIARSRTFYNEADVLRQLGHVMVPGPVKQ